VTLGGGGARGAGCGVFERLMPGTKVTVPPPFYLESRGVETQLAGMYVRGSKPFVC
jgi:hypothetical protein